jgi:hypothetical protein
MEADIAIQMQNPLCVLPLTTVTAYLFISSSVSLSGLLTTQKTARGRNAAELSV